MGSSSRRSQTRRPGNTRPRNRIGVGMRFRLALGVIAAGLAGATYLFVVWFRTPAETEILGRPMAYWIGALQGPDPEERADAAYALSLPDSVTPTACRALAGRLTDEYEVRSHI